MKIKGKKNKKRVADRVSSKPTVEAHNPFEVRVNRKKHKIIGQRSKNEKGLPGIARSRAIKKRKATLLQEYKLKGKSNMFVDRRIGEKDASMTLDDKITARYTTERMRFHSRKSLYNLDDTELLTHRGESLADIEKFEEPLKSDDEDEEDRDRSGKLGEDFVKEAHFGGGMLKRVEGEGMSRKDLIDKMIAESKLRKLDQQKLREETLDLTEKLDSEWSEIVGLIHSSKSREDGPTLPSDKKYATYDKLSKELKFEARGRATDKLKSAEEIAKEEKKKLDELEKQRIARMRGDSSTSGPKHRSADDLDEGFDYNEAPKAKKNINEEDSEFDLPARASSSEDSEEESEEEKEEAKEDDEENDEEVVEESDDSDETDDDLEDLKDGSDDSDEEEEEDEEKKGKKQKSPTKSSIKNVEKLPFTLNVPDSFDEFSRICAGREPEYQATVLERMIKSNHPSVSGGSREKLVNLFMFCMQHLQDIASDPSTQQSTFKILDKLAPWLFDLVPFNVAKTSTLVSDVIKEKYADFMKHPRRFPGIETLVFFKLVGILYPTSDYRHRLVTPTLLFMQQVLASSRIHSSTDVATGLFIATLILEYTAVSKRYTPEAINFLKGCLRSAQPNEASLKSVPPFKARSEFSLHVPSVSGFLSEDICALSTKDLTTPTGSPQFKLSAVSLALGLLEEFITPFQNAEEYLIVQPFESLLTVENYCTCLHPAISKINSRISTLKSKKLYKLLAEAKRPRPLRLLEPRIEEVYAFRKSKPYMSKEKEEHGRLMHKYKREVKGALREIRRDNSFLSKLKYTEAKASDMERKRKVKAIFGDAAQQAGEINKLKRAK